MDLKVLVNACYHSFKGGSEPGFACDEGIVTCKKQIMLGIIIITNNNNHHHNDYCMRVHCVNKLLINYTENTSSEAMFIKIEKCIACTPQSKQY